MERYPQDHNERSAGWNRFCTAERCSVLRNDRIQPPFWKDDASDEEIAKAAEIAQATEFIEAKDDKYETPIAQGGSNVSGGQKQRLAIARAILADNKILILVMKDGDIIEQGNHEELLAANGFYANLYNSQFEDVVA